MRRARDWRWSSARAHLAGESDFLVTVAPLLKRLRTVHKVLGVSENPLVVMLTVLRQYHVLIE